MSIIASFDKSAFLVIFYEEIVSEALSEGLAVNASDIYGLEMVDIAPISTDIESEDGDSNNEDLMDTSKPWIWFILFGVIAFVLMVLASMLSWKLRNAQQRERRDTEMSTLHITPYDGRSPQIAMTASIDTTETHQNKVSPVADAGAGGEHEEYELL